MNYQEIVNRIQFITSQHKMLVDFGYGDISDLKSRFENNSGDSAVQADYPYLFLNPGVHGRNQGMVTYNFNMVVMDMAREEVSDQPYNNMLAIQSQCQQYIDDVLAYLYFEYKDNPDVIYSGVTYIPFNERFQDNVAGMTATLTIQVPQPLDNCVAPFIVPPITADFIANNLIPEEDEFVTFTDLSTNDPTQWAWTFAGGTPATSTQQNPVIQYQTIGDYTVSLTASKIGSTDTEEKIDYITVIADQPDLVLDTATNAVYIITPDTEQSPMEWRDTTLDTFNGIRPGDPYNYYDINANGTWTFILTGTGTRITDAATFPTAIDIFFSDPGSIEFQADVSNWPANPSVGVPFDFELQWTNLALTTDYNTGQWRCTDVPAVEDRIDITAGAVLKGYYLA